MYNLEDEKAKEMFKEVKLTTEEAQRWNSCKLLNTLWTIL